MINTVTEKCDICGCIAAGDGIFSKPNCAWKMTSWILTFAYSLQRWFAIFCRLKPTFCPKTISASFAPSFFALRTHIASDNILSSSDFSLSIFLFFCNGLFVEGGEGPCSSSKFSKLLSSFVFSSASSVLYSSIS